MLKIFFVIGDMVRFGGKMSQLDGTRVLITGGTDGIGKGIARVLLEDGARVYIFSRSQEKLKKALTELEPLGEVYGFNADVSWRDEVKEVFSDLDNKLKGLDVLINNAGIAGAGVEQESEENTEYILSTNLGGYLFCAKEAIERMKKEGKGHIVNIGSLSAVTKDPGSGVYVSAKSGIEGFTESLRKEVGKQNIKVTLIEPGAVATALHGLPTGALREEVAGEEMLKVEDIAKIVQYVLSVPWRVDVITVQVKPRKQDI